MLSYDNCTLEGLIDTIGHEMCHASQWQNGNRAMLNSLRNYKSPDAGFDAYWNQLCERDARQGGVDFLDFILDAVQGLAA